MPDAHSAKGLGSSRPRSATTNTMRAHEVTGRFTTARRRVLASGPLTLLGTVLVAACGSAATGGVTAPRSHRTARWLAFAHPRRPLDLVASEDGRHIVAAADGRLWLLGPTGTLTPVAQGPQGVREPGRRGA